MRRGEEREDDRLDTFLIDYVDSHELRDAWNAGAAQTAFTKEFQEKLSALMQKNQPRTSRRQQARGVPRPPA